MPDISIPQARRIVVDTTGAQIVQEESPATRDSRGIYLPHYIEPVSHIAIDIGGSLAKVVYFTRSSEPLTTTTPPSSHPSSPFLPPSQSLSTSAQTTTATASTSANGTALATSQPISSESSSHLVSNDAAQSGTSSSTFSPTLNPHSHAPFDPSPPDHRRPTVNGALTPGILTSEKEFYADGQYPSSTPTSPSTSVPPPAPSNRHTKRHKPHAGGSITSHPHLRRSSIPPPLPGGLLNFARFETDRISDLIQFLQDLISTSASANRVSLDKMKKNVKVMATGGGAHLFYERLRGELGVEVRREEEMDCLILGLGFVARVPEEVFWFSEELVYKVSHRGIGSDNIESHPNTGANGHDAAESDKPRLTIPPAELPRPSPTPPAYQVSFANPNEPSEAQTFPCLVVNIGSGVSIVKVDEEGKFERVSGTSLGGGTLWGLLSLLTDAESFDEMLLLSEKGDNAAVDMLVGDIYGSDYSKIGLKSSTIASSFGKVFRNTSGEDGGHTASERKKRFKQEDIAKSLLYAISNNIGHVAYMNAAKYGLDRVYFGGCFIRGHAATISTLSYAIRFWSKGTMRACFLRHEGFLGAIGAWIKNVEPGEPSEQSESVDREATNGREEAVRDGMAELRL